jgi:predicted nucleic acid-binding protein
VYSGNSHALSVGSPGPALVGLVIHHLSSHLSWAAGTVSRSPILIAAMAFQHDLTLVTTDAKHFPISELHLYTPE